LTKRTAVHISIIIVLSVVVGILYNSLSREPVPLIGEKREDFTIGDSLMLEMLRQDSIQRAADSLKKISLSREDSVRIAEEQKVRDSLERAKLDSLRQTADSLKAAKKRLEDSLKALENTKQDTAKTFVKPVDIKLDFAKLLYDKRYVFIDARDEKDYSAGHIAGAVNIPYHSLEEHKSALNRYSKNQVIVVYCGAGCDVSIDMGYAMANMGFTRVYIFHGGWDDWKAAGYPTE
jgi:rhodanese-related sulfurtransferase